MLDCDEILAAESVRGTSHGFLNRRLDVMKRCLTSKSFEIQERCIVNITI